jgi:hypothetical protein
MSLPAEQEGRITDNNKGGGGGGGGGAGQEFLGIDSVGASRSNGTGGGGGAIPALPLPQLAPRVDLVGPRRYCHCSPRHTRRMPFDSRSVSMTRRAIAGRPCSSAAPEGAVAVSTRQRGGQLSVPTKQGLPLGPFQLILSSSVHRISTTRALPSTV